MLDPFAGTKIKPLARGKQRDSYTLSAAGLAGGHFWEGAVRSGKTIASIVRFLEFAVTGPPGELMMIGKTERSLKRNVLDTIVSLLGRSRVKLTMGSGEMRIGERVIYLTGANNEGALARVQGATLVGFYGDEIPTWPQSIFDMARTRCSMPGAEWFGTGNPESATHHLKTDWIDRAKLHLRRDGSVVRRSASDTQNVHVYSFTIYDNPQLSAEFVQSLERSYVGMFRRRYILGEWCMAEGAVYDTWDPDQHVIRFSDIPQVDAWIGAGVDYGTVNPFHAGTLAIGPAPFDREGKALYVTSEYRYDPAKKLRRMTNREYGLALQRWLRQDVRHPGSDVVGIEPEVLAIDPSAASFRTELWNMGVASVMADNEVLPGIRDVASLIAYKKLYICEDAPELIGEIPAYAWDDRAAKLGQDKPIKVNDHGCDQLRYVIRTTRHDWWDVIFPDMVASANES